MEVSVILPSYNHAPFLKDRIDSILNQSFQDFELIILDDKSPDNSQYVIEQYRGEPRISHIVYNESNSGLTYKQWNKGVGLAKGKYVWIAESDDTAHPELLETLYNNITNTEGAVISYCQSARMNKDGKIGGSWVDQGKKESIDLFSSDFVMDGMNFIENYMLLRNFIPNASANLFNRETFIKIGKADTNVGYMSDWLTWMKMLTQGKVVFSSKSLNNFRNHLDPQTPPKWTNAKNYRSKTSHINMRKAFAIYAKENKLSKKIQKRNKRMLAKNYLEEAIFLSIRWQIVAILGYVLNALKYLR